MKVHQIIQDIQKYETYRNETRAKIADLFNDDQITEAKELIVKLDGITDLLNTLYDLDVETTDKKSVNFK